MLQSFLRFLLRTAFYMVVWVFLLAIHWDGRTLFDRAHEVLVENAFVELLNDEAQEVWDRAYASAEEAFTKHSSRSKHADDPETE